MPSFATFKISSLGAYSSAISPSCSDRTALEAQPIALGIALVYAGFNP
jgi:hypothetical protein